jgi:uncharacterized membrane protein
MPTSSTGKTIWRNEMSNLTVVMFEDEETAGKLRETIRQGERAAKINVDDAAVVVKDANGKIHVKHETDKGVVAGAVGGSFLGLLLASAFFPLAGIITGAVGGALVGKMAKDGVDRDFAKEVADALEPGSSALFVVTHDSDPTYVRAMLKSYEGEIYHTTLDSETEEAIRAALRKSS